MKVAIIKYNAGNIYSVVHSLNRLGIEPLVTDDKNDIMTADCVIFPGQGEARKTMENLRANQLDQVIKGLQQPVLGICIGMQLLCNHSEEGDTDCLGIFDTTVRHFTSTEQSLKIPHMGWDTITNVDSPLFESVNNDSYVYFIHSYYVPITQHTIAQNDYILPFSAALHKNNFYATQFHPEKSGQIGEQILQNFLNISHQ